MVKEVYWLLLAKDNNQDLPFNGLPMAAENVGDQRKAGGVQSKRYEGARMDLGFPGGFRNTQWFSLVDAFCTVEEDNGNLSEDSTDMYDED